MIHSVVHTELQSSNVKKSKEFYSKLFGWKSGGSPRGGPNFLDMGEDEVSIGFADTTCPEKSTFWINYILVENLEAAMAKAKSLGATLITDVEVVPDTGRFCFILDPLGARLSLWERLKKE